MKFFYQLIMIMSVLSFAACSSDDVSVDDKDVVVDPNEVENLSELLPLKDYVDFSKHPDFKLGCAVDEDPFIKGGVVRSLVASNFVEITPGNAMKYASCVDSKGNMNFSKVVDFINAAKKAKVSVYGHTLAWHSQQNKQYLQSLISDNQTAQQTKDIISAALDQWISGIMEACAGRVTSWDVVNEAISGDYSHLINGKYYPLQHTSNVSENDAKNCFYWQDYLGDIDYVRIAVESARKHFAEFGGEPSQLKLFINDYNLETSYDNNRKAESMKYWVSKWEEDGVTKIDGIGSQMHISYSMNESKQKRNEECVVNMLKILASTGKLIKISELDMGLENASGASINTSNVTPDQEKAMGEYYKFIVEKYFEIIPVDQQYGICQWCLTDSPKNSGWRPETPTGLWTEQYTRKYTYQGFAEGLYESMK